MPTLQTFLASPLARHPGLLARKIAQRLHLYRENGPLPRPAAATVTIPRHFKRALEQWVRHVPLIAQKISFTRLFGRDFDEAMLLKLCAEGPVKGAANLTGDIKLIWDFSRAHPLFLNLCINPNHLDDGAAFIHRWLQANNNTDGPAWICAMDVALRAVNWIAADAISGGELGRRVGAREWSEWLWRHGIVIWRRLESRAIPSNHYLADLLGLLAVGAVFPADARAQRWHRFARNEFPRALLSQTGKDGGLNEASLRYHAFVTEMALVVRIINGGPFPRDAEQRLADMCQMLADFRDGTGDVFPFGDDDSGRVLALDHASTLGRADVLLKLAESALDRGFKARQRIACPNSGWWLRRFADWTVAVEFGGVGLHGLGSHAHSDDLSFCLEWRGQPLVVDPGTYAYTWNPAARNRFRSASAHNAVIVDNQDPLKPGEHLFYLPGRDEPWDIRDEDRSCTFLRQITDQISHRRTIKFDSAQELVIEDEITGHGTHQLEWRFHFDPRWAVTAGAGRFQVQSAASPSVWLEVSPTAATLETVAGEFSTGYGEITSCSVATVRQQAALPARCVFTFRSTPPAS